MAHKVNQQETTICPKYCGSYKTLLNTGINPITEHAWERSTPWLSERNILHRSPWEKHQPLKPMMHLSVCRAFKYLNLSLIISEAGSLRLLSPTKNKQRKSASPFCIVKQLSSHHQQHSVATKFPRGNMLWGARCVTTEDFQAAGGLEGGTKGEPKDHQVFLKSWPTPQRIAKAQISPAKLSQFNIFRPKFYSETPWNVERFFKFHWSECMSNVCRIRFTKIQQSPTYLPIGVIFCTRWPHVVMRPFCREPMTCKQGPTLWR